MKCLLTSLSILVLSLTISCSDEATSPGERISLGADVSATFGGGLNPVRAEIHITPVSELTVRDVDGRDGSIVREVRRLLSNDEVVRLQTLFEPFEQYDPYYSPELPPIDAGSVRIRFQTDDIDHEVSVYPVDYPEVPPGLKELVDELIALLE